MPPPNLNLHPKHQDARHVGVAVEPVHQRRDGLRGGPGRVRPAGKEVRHGIRPTEKEDRRRRRGQRDRRSANSTINC